MSPSLLFHWKHGNVLGLITYAVADVHRPVLYLFQIHFNVFVFSQVLIKCSQYQKVPFQFVNRQSFEILQHSLHYALIFSTVQTRKLCRPSVDILCGRPVHLAVGQSLLIERE